MMHLTERIAEFVFDELSPTEMSEARSHLAACADCRNQVSAFQQTHALLRTSADFELPRRIVFEAERPRAVSWMSRWFSPAAAAIAASILTALMLRPVAAPPVQPVERVVVQQPAGSAPAVQTIDYDRIINEVRASQEKWLADELQKRDMDQRQEIQRVRTELAYLGNVQLSMRKDTMENTASIQVLAQKSDSQD